MQRAPGGEAPAGHALKMNSIPFGKGRLLRWCNSERALHFSSEEAVGSRVESRRQSLRAGRTKDVAVEVEASQSCAVVGII